MAYDPTELAAAKADFALAVSRFETAIGFIPNLAKPIMDGIVHAMEAGVELGKISSHAGLAQQVVTVGATLENLKVELEKVVTWINSQ